MFANKNAKGRTLLIMGFIILSSTCALAASGSLPNAVPDPTYQSRNNGGAVGYWELGNVAGRALYAFDEHLAVGGWFTHAGGVASEGAAMWDGTNWEAAGTGLEQFDQAVLAFVRYNDTIVAGGQFTHFGGNLTPHVAILDTSIPGSWLPLMPNAPDNVVWALADFFQGGQEYLIAGGQFMNAGGVQVNGIARWNGSAWQPMGDGFTWEVSPGQFIPGIVYSLFVFNDELYAGGAFTHSGTEVLNNIARWNGSAWVNVDFGFDGPVMAIGEWNAHLIAGGHFMFGSDEPTPLFYVARLNAGEWESIGIGTNGGVYAIENFGMNLVIGGEFDEAGGMNCQHIAQWNGHDWSAIGAGVADNRVFGLEVFRDELYATGAFMTSQEVTLNCIARWQPLHWMPLGIGLAGPVFRQSPVQPISVAAASPVLSVQQEAGTYVVLYSLPEAADVSVDVVDVSGRSLAKLGGGFMGAGEHRVVWDPSAASGIYFVRLQSAGHQVATRCLITK